MRQSQPVVLRDTSESRQPQIKEEGGRAPIVTRPPLHGYLVAPPGPITHIHIQKLQLQSTTLGIDLKAAKPEKAVPKSFYSSSHSLPVEHWTFKTNDWHSEGILLTELRLFAG